jgi:AraC-like DNA-binding protein
MECKIHALVGRGLRAQIPGILRLREIGHRERALRPDLLSALPALIYGVGFQEETLPTYRQHGLQRGNTEIGIIQYTVSGRGRLRYEGRELVVEPGQAMLLHCPSDHCYWIEEGERWEFCYVTLGGPSAIRGIREAIDQLGPVVTLDRDAPALARLTEACTAVFEDRIESPYVASELAYGLVMALLGPAKSDQGVASASTPKFVTDVEQFCRANLTRPIGVDDLARVAKMSRFHFTRMFEKARGISPGRFLATLRLEESLRLISRGCHSVKKVAEECGYGDANYFCKVFRKSFGVSPGAFRTGVIQNRGRAVQAAADR